MKKLLKIFIPVSGRVKLAAWLTQFRFRILKWEWNRQRGVSSKLAQMTPSDRVLIVPSDPHQLTGSIGDEAMIAVVKQAVYSRNPNFGIDILTAKSGIATARHRGLRPIALWDSFLFATALRELIVRERYAAVFGVGADVIDGKYGFLDPAKMLVAVHQQAKLGLPAIILGSSFCSVPDIRLKPFFDTLHDGVKIFMRDPISQSRFGCFSTKKSILVADTAFMLVPGTVDRNTADWVAAKRAEGKLVIGFNLHPMLLDTDGDFVGRLVKPSVAVLQRIHGNRDIAWLLIPHDRRERVGDLVVLNPIFESLAPVLEQDIMLLSGQRSAQELKAVAGILDGVITGRMHLAIGALGAGVPALCIIYQDKFEGLYQHFGLDGAGLLSVDAIQDINCFVDAINTYLDRLPLLREQIVAALPGIRDKSAQNFMEFLNSASEVSRAQSQFELS